ncbi:MAG: hypothetical protein ACN6O6_15770 [Pseudomonas sp.]|uniref:hypothetical protein n=1 Tax=Pseudomonas sp. TaxID=306 RepID=UPI003D11658B
MTPWIVLLLLIVVLSPVALLMPSRRQRGRMDMRMQARRLGLAMQLSRQEWPHWLHQAPPSPCPQYYRGRKRGQADCWSYWQLEPGNWVNRWREPCEDVPLLEQLSSLPTDVYKAEASVQMVSLYWGERASTEALQKIADFLTARA